jgi:hypothetical protein
MIRRLVLRDGAATDRPAFSPAAFLTYSFPMRDADEHPQACQLLAHPDHRYPHNPLSACQRFERDISCMCHFT